MDPFYDCDCSGSGNGIRPAGISHFDIRDIGINTHAQIDAHIANNVNPHGTVLTQDDVIASTITSSAGSSTVNNVVISQTQGLSGVASAPLVLTSGFQIAPTFTLTKYFGQKLIASPTTFPWAVTQSFTWYIQLYNTSVLLTNCGTNSAAFSLGTTIVFPNLIPTFLRPAVLTTHNIPVLTNGVSSTGSIAINVDGTVTITGGFAVGQCGLGTIRVFCYNI